MQSVRSVEKVVLHIFLWMLSLESERKWNKPSKIISSECHNSVHIPNYSPCGTFQSMKDHSKHIKLYTPLTDHAVSIDSNGGLSKNHGP